MENCNQVFRDRSKRFCIDIAKSLAKLPYADDLSVFRKQVIRSSSSVASNYRAVGRSRSENEKFAKMCIVVEEIDETQLWLEIIDEMEYLTKEKISPLLAECEELVITIPYYILLITHYSLPITHYPLPIKDGYTSKL